MTATRLRRYLRMAFYALELVIAVPLAIPCILLGWLGILADRFAEPSILVAHIPFYVGEQVRYLYYLATLRRVGRRVTFKYGSFCQHRGATIGSRVVVGYYNALGLVAIGDDVSDRRLRELHLGAPPAWHRRSVAAHQPAARPS